MLSKGGLQSRDSDGTLNSDGAGNGEQELEMTESEYSRALGEPAGSSFYIIVGKHFIAHHTHKSVLFPASCLNKDLHFRTTDCDC